MVSETSPRLDLDYVMAAQAQKHVTVNDALRKLDAFVQATAKSRLLDLQPDDPVEGDAYILPPGATGADWSMMSENSFAVFRDTEWVEIPPVPGFRVWLRDLAELVVFDGSVWTNLNTAISSLQNLDRLGVGTAADAANPFAAKLNAALWTALEDHAGGTGDLRYTLNKQAESNVLSLLMQSGYSARAEIGLIGEDSLVMKTSDDGANWNQTLRASPDAIEIGTANGIEVRAINGQSPGSSRNLLINGDFSVAQRGSAFLAPVSGDYFLDRWRLVASSGMDCDFQQESFPLGQTDVPGEPTHYLKWEMQGSASGNPWIEQRIENVRLLPVGPAVLSFYAKASRMVSINTWVRRDFGNGGSPTDALVHQRIDLTENWQRLEMNFVCPTLAGVLLGDNHHIKVEFYLDNEETSVDIDLADLQLERGNMATPFDRRPFDETLQKCQRYFAKTYAVSVAPAAQTIAGALATSTCAPSNTAVFDWRFPVEMRSVPAISLFSPLTGLADAAEVNGADLAASALSVSPTAVACQTLAHSGLEIARLHITADAEL